MRQDPDTRSGFTRRSLLKGSLAAGIAAALGPAVALGATAEPGGRPRIGPDAPDGSGEDDLILHNGKIHTMDGQGTVARSVTIRNGRIVEVGSGVAAGGRARSINLHGRTVVPGIIDNHNHIVLMGNRPGHHTPLENAYSIADVQAIHAARAAGIPAGDWITTIGGFHTNHFAEVRLPTLGELDAAVPDNPAYLSLSFAGPSTTNSLGKAFFEAANPPVTVGADGSIAGGFGDSPTGRATLALRRALLTPETRRRGAIDALDYGLSLGVTTHLDQGAFQKTDTPADGAAHEDNFSMHLPFLDLYREGLAAARLRINFLHMESDPDTPELLARLQNQFPFFGGEWVKTGGIGEFIANTPGSPGSPSAQFVNAATRIAERGWRAEVHSLSPTDFQAEIQGFEAAHASFPISDLRWVVAHVPFINDEYTNRLKALGGGLSLTGWRYLAGTLGAVPAGPPFRMIVDNGINAGLSSDGMQIAPMNPWIHMYYATTGLNGLGVEINSGQQITREEALRLYTRDNGWFLREEHDLGTIEVGKLADLVVLNDDYFTVDDVRTIRSVLTVVGGIGVHDEGAVG